MLGSLTGRTLSAEDWRVNTPKTYGVVSKPTVYEPAQVVTKPTIYEPAESIVEKRVYAPVLDFSKPIVYESAGVVSKPIVYEPAKVVFKPVIVEKPLYSNPVPYAGVLLERKLENNIAEDIRKFLVGTTGTPTKIVSNPAITTPVASVDKPVVYVPNPAAVGGTLNTGTVTPSPQGAIASSSVVGEITNGGKTVATPIELPAILDGIDRRLLGWGAAAAFMILMGG